MLISHQRDIKFSIHIWVRLTSNGTNQTFKISFSIFRLGEHLDVKCDIPVWHTVWSEVSIFVSGPEPCMSNLNPNCVTLAPNVMGQTREFFQISHQLHPFLGRNRTSWLGVNIVWIEAVILAGPIYIDLHGVGPAINNQRNISCLKTHRSFLATNLWDNSRTF